MTPDPIEAACVMVDSLIANHVSTAAGGAAGDEVSADYEGREIRIGLNSTYLLQALSALDSDDVNLSVTGELDPMVIQPADNGDYTAIVMPVRI